jgi:hypothetical protein
LRKEIAGLVDIGVHEEDYTSEWASPTFAITKKNGTIRVVSHFRKLNALLQRQPFPIPKLGDMIRSMEGFTFTTALDLNMGYCHIKLVPYQIGTISNWIWMPNSFVQSYFLGESININPYPWASK